MRIKEDNNGKESWQRAVLPRRILRSSPGRRGKESSFTLQADCEPEIKVGKQVRNSKEKSWCSDRYCRFVLNGPKPFFSNSAQVLKVIARSALYFLFFFCLLLAPAYTTRSFDEM